MTLGDGAIGNKRARANEGKQSNAIVGNESTKKKSTQGNSNANANASPQGDLASIAPHVVVERPQVSANDHEWHRVMEEMKNEMATMRATLRESVKSMREDIREEFAKLRAAMILSTNNVQKEGNVGGEGDAHVVDGVATNVSGLSTNEPAITVWKKTCKIASTRMGPKVEQGADAALYMKKWTWPKVRGGRGEPKQVANARRKVSLFYECLERWAETKRGDGVPDNVSRSNAFAALDKALMAKYPTAPHARYLAPLHVAWRDTVRKTWWEERRDANAGDVKSKPSAADVAARRESLYVASSALFNDVLRTSVAHL